MAATAGAARARCLLAANSEDAIARLAEALGDFDRLGCSWDATRMRGELRAQGTD